MGRKKLKRDAGEKEIKQLPEYSYGKGDLDWFSIAK